jgi:hypothetical protein
MARQQQQQQQQLIEQGTSLINAVFGGGSADSYTPFQGTPAQGGLYYTLNPQGQYVPYSVPMQQAIESDRGSARGTRDQEQWVASSTTADRRGPSTLYTKQSTQYPGFGPDFYAARTKAFENYAMPFLQQQYGKTANQLKYQLANQGLLGGSSAGQLQNNLQREYGAQRQNIANQALASSQGLQQQIGQGKAQLMGQLQTSVNPLSTANQALGIASQFQAPSPMPAIGNLFQNWANQYLAGQQAQASNNYANQYLNVLNSYMNPLQSQSSAGANAPTATYSR